VWTVEPTRDRYVGFYENEYGEQLVFLRESGGEPMIYHGDFGWAPVPANWPERFNSPGVSLSPWVSGELVLNQGEALWIAACLEASGSRKEQTPVEGPIDRLVIQEVKGAFERDREQHDRRWSLLDKAFDLWKERQTGTPTSQEEHYAEGAIKVALGLNAKQRKAGAGVTKENRERLEREAAVVVREVEG
jgi:hypothetical protein